MDQSALFRSIKPTEARILRNTKSLTLHPEIPTFSINMELPTQPESSPYASVTQAPIGKGSSAMARWVWEDAARKDGDANSLWFAANTRWTVINQKFLDSSVSIDAIESDLHDLWFLFYVASKNILHSSPAMDRLVLQLPRAREQGYLKKQNQDGLVITASTSDGIIWADLPFLVTDMTNFWQKDCASMSAAQRLNHATFLAKLASIGISDKICGVALLLFRQTLETPRPLGKLDKLIGEDSSRTLENLSIGDLLPLVNQWVFEAGNKIIQLSDLAWNDGPDEIVQPGVIYREDRFDAAITSSGFSVDRWIFWLRRLDIIQTEAWAAGKGELAEFTGGVMDNMIFSLDGTDSAVGRAWRASPDDIIQHRPTIKLLGPVPITS